MPAEELAVSEIGPLTLGDRVRRLRSRLMAGTVVRIIQDDPQIVEVTWDRVAPPFNLVTLLASSSTRLDEGPCLRR
jgi:hypothetical protein